MCIFLLYDIKTSQLIKQTYSQNNQRVKINKGSVFETLNKLKTHENKKGRNQICSNRNLKKKKKILIWKHPALSQQFLHKFLQKCSIDLIFAAIERRFENLKLCNLSQSHKKWFWRPNVYWNLRGFDSFCS